MAKWEYFRQTTDGFTDRQLAWYGSEGWELVCIYDNTWIFKRMIKEPHHEQ